MVSLTNGCRLLGGGAFFSILAVVALLLGLFWWPGESSSWANFIRISMGFALVFFILDSFFNGVALRFTVLSAFCMVLMGYLILNSLLLADDLQSLRRLLLIVLFFLGVHLVGKAGEKWWVGVLSLAVLVAAGFAAFSVVNKLIMGELLSSYRGKVFFGSGIDGVADFGHRVVAGLHYAFYFIVAVWLLVSSKSLKLKVLWSLCLVAIGVYIYLTSARSSWVAAFVGGGGAVFLTVDRKTFAKVLLGTVVLVMALIAIGALDIVYQVAGKGVYGRDEIWLAVLSMMPGHWLFGYGAGTPFGSITVSWGEVFNSHSLYLEILYQFGLVGLVLFVFTMSMAFFRLLKSGGSLSVLWVSILSAMALVMLVEQRGFVSSPNAVWMWLWLPMAGALAIDMGGQRAQG